TVDHARLSWGGNNGKYGYSGGSTRDRCDNAADTVETPPGSAESTDVRVQVDGGSTQSVAPEVFNQSDSSVNGPQYYGAEADVTSLFDSVGSGTSTVAVGDVWAPTGLGCVGGWSLTIVYKFENPDPDTQTMRNFYIYSGLTVQRSSDAPTDIAIDGFAAASDTDSRASVTAYEGDRSTTGDRFKVNGANIAEPSSGASNNFFMSHADGAAQRNDENNLNVDAETFNLPAGAVPAGSTSAKLTLETSGDTYVAQQVAFSVPVPDLEVTKTGSPETVYAGDTVTYTVEVENISNLDYPNAKLSDDLTEVLDDAEFGEVTASTGTAEFNSPNVEWTGDVPAGDTATIEYTAKVNDPISGDGELINHVVSSGSRPTSCEAEAEGDTEAETEGDSDTGAKADNDDCGTSQTIKPANRRPDTGDSGAKDAMSGGLPITGSNYWTVILAALGCVIGGIIAMAWRRHVRQHH
ncbi:MAG: DUF11 domain-containing protein, partial [Stackebrandtia sp.]